MYSTAHCYIMGHLTITVVYNRWITTPPSGIFRTPRLRGTSGMSNDEDAWNYREEDIIHAYVRLLYDSTPTSNGDSYKNEQRIDQNWEPNREWPKFPQLRHEGQFRIREKRHDIGHYLLAWEYNIRDAVVLPVKLCTGYNTQSNIFSDFWKCVKEPGAKPWTDIEISGLTLQPRGYNVSTYRVQYVNSFLVVYSVFLPQWMECKNPYLHLKNILELEY